MSDDQNREIFLEEALDLLAELETTLLELEGDPHSLDLVNRVFRALHTIKGSGAMFGFDDIAAFTHDIENVFDKVRNEELQVSHALISTAFHARDHILGMLNGPDASGVGSPESGERILKDVQTLLAGTQAEQTQDLSPEPGAALQEQAAAQQSAAAAPDEAAPPVTYLLRIRAREPKVDKPLHLERLFDDLRGLGQCTVRVDQSGLPPLSGLDPQTLYLAWEAELTTAAGEEAIRELFFFTDIDLDLDIRQGEAGEDLVSGQPDAQAQPAPALEVEEKASRQAAAPVPEPAPQPMTRAAAAQAAPVPDAGVPKLGEILVQQGAIRPEDLDKALSQQKPLGRILTESGLVTETQVEQAIAAQKQSREATAARQQKDAVASLRVAADKLDHLVDLVGELVIVQAQISQTVVERGDPALAVLSEQLERLSADLRDSTLGIRMLPIGSAFSKFRRLVRDLSEELGKEIELVTRGEETELDKTVLERLGDPLVHLLRNSIDHGIDTPQERLAAGKRAQGLILLEAEHSGSEVLIRITDDGKGMDTAAIRNKAVEKGLIGAEQELGEQEILKLIFLPGFSTAAKVTSISGRGVGMDVVHRAIDSLRGGIEIQSAKGQGTTITIRLPLTLAIIEGLQVQVGPGYFVIPLAIVEECVELLGRDVDQSRKEQLIHLRGELVPYINLRSWFEIPGEHPPIEQVVITGVEGRRVGLAVDRVIGEHQTVIKSLGRMYRDVEGISGATIKGDGTLALILDVPRLVRSVAEVSRS